MNKRIKKLVQMDQHQFEEFMAYVKRRFKMELEKDPQSDAPSENTLIEVAPIKSSIAAINPVDDLTVKKDDPVAKDPLNNHEWVIELAVIEDRVIQDEFVKDLTKEIKLIGDPILP